MQTTNPFTEARGKIDTIGQCIDALVDAFSKPESGDTMGAYILERALEEVQARRPARQAEWDAFMAAIDASLKKAEEPKKTYADTLEAGYQIEAFMRANGKTGHSGYSQRWTVQCYPHTYIMEIIPSSNIPRYTCDNASVTAAAVYAALIQI